MDYAVSALFNADSVFLQDDDDAALDIDGRLRRSNAAYPLFALCAEYTVCAVRCCERLPLTATLFP